MAQGAFKAKAKAAPSKAIHSKRQASKVAKPKTKAPASKASIEKAHRKFTSGMVAKTEAALGERAGHLELIGEGKKAKKKTNAKGGSKKFG